MPESRGFTLIELLVVIAITGLLASIVLVSLNSARKKARDARRIADLQQIKKALELYYSNNGHYPPPSTEPSCVYNQHCFASSWSWNWPQVGTMLSPYLSKLPKDPLNTPYGCSPYQNDCFIYQYGDVGNPDAPYLGNAYPDQYVLTARLEATDNPLRCELKGYRWYWDSRYWCPPWDAGASYGQSSRQVYELGIRP